MKNVLLLSFLVFGLSSCWAPRCPMETCKVIHEHKHQDLVSGIFSPRYRPPKRLHFIWDKNKGENNPDTELETSGGRKRIKGKKKFPWERW